MRFGIAYYVALKFFHFVLLILKCLSLKEIKIQALALKKKLFYLHQWKPFKNDEKYFIFHP